jgi:hypothetical protein
MKNEKEKINRILLDRNEIVEALNYCNKDEKTRKDNLKTIMELSHDLAIYNNILGYLGVELPE